MTSWPGDDWRDRYPLPHPRQDRRRRHGCRLSRRGHAARPPGRRQVPLGASCRRIRSRSSASSARRAPRRRSTIRTSARSTTSAATATCRSSSWSCSTATTLRRRIAARPLPMETVLDFGVQIADALDAAHAARHRPSRHQVGEHLRHRARPDQDARLRAGEAGQPRGAPVDPYSDDDRAPRRTTTETGQTLGHAVVHVAGAGARRGRSTRAATCSRSASCSTRWRPAASRSPAETSALDLRRDPASDAGAAERRQPARPGRARPHHRQGAREGSRPPLSDARPSCAPISSACSARAARSRRQQPIARATRSRRRRARDRRPARTTADGARRGGSPPRSCVLAAAGVVVWFRGSAHGDRLGGRAAVRRRRAARPTPNT